MIPTSILTLDLATTTGWAISQGGAEPDSGFVKFPDTGVDYGRFLNVYDRWLVKKITENNIDFAAYEEPVGTRNLRTSMRLQNLAGHTEFRCTKMKVKCVCVPIPTWRKHFIGRGTGFKKLKLDPKVMAVDACLERGWNPEIHDEAEALGILDYVFAKLEMSKVWPDAGLFAGVGK